MSDDLRAFMQLHLGVLFPDVELKAKAEGLQQLQKEASSLCETSELFSSAVCFPTEHH